MHERQESIMQRPLPRRTLAKSAAWSVPVVAAAGVTPAFAASREYHYDIAASWQSVYGYRSYYGYYYLDSLRFTNDYSDWNSRRGIYSPPGFAGLDQRADDGSMSPTTDMTLTEYTMTLYYRAGMVNTSLGSNGFTYSNVSGRTYWGTPTVERNVLLTNTATGYSGYYDAFTFTWQGSTTEKTVQGSSSSATQSWPNSNTLVGDWSVNGNYQVSTNMYFGVKLDWAFTTANGVSGNNTQTYWTPMVAGGR